MNKKPILKIFSLASSQSVLELDSLTGDKYREAVNFELSEVSRPEEAHVIVWDGILNPKSEGIVEALRPLLDRGLPLLLTGERRAFIDDSEVAESFISPSWKTLVLPPWGSVPETILLSLAKLMERDPYV